MRRSETSLCFGRHHPCLEGHFEGRPVVPAAAILAELIAWAERELERRVTGVTRARFQAPLVPETHWRVELEARSNQEARIACTREGRVVMSAKLALEQV